MTEAKLRDRRWIGTTLKVLFCVAATLLIIFTVMANIGGTSPTLKKSIEEFIEDGTGYRAEIGTLHNMSFFPDIAFDFESTELYRTGQIDAVAYAGRVQVAFSFWDVMASTGKIKKLNIEHFITMPDILLKTQLTVDSLKIVDNGEEPRLVGSGTIGDQDFTISSGMKAKGIGQGKKYTFGSERDFFVTLGNLTLAGKMKGADNNGIILENLDLKTKDKPVLSGNVELERGEMRVNVTGNFKMHDHGSDLAPNIGLFIRQRGGVYKTEGEIKSESFHVEDFMKASAYGQAMSTIESAFGVQDVPETVMIKLKAANIYRDSVPKGAYDAPLPLKGWRVDTIKLGKSE
jgi:hypothetical protein